MRQQRRKLNKIRRDLGAVTPVHCSDPLPPQPSILPPPPTTIEPILVKGARKVDNLINRYPGIKESINYARPTRRQGRKEKNPKYKIKGLKFSKPDHIDVSIVIPVFNKYELSVNCLASLQNNVSNEVSYEVIVVDNNSTDETHNLSQVEGLKYLKNKENLGFVRGCNSGAKKAVGDYIVFLNNDALATEGWLESLFSTIKSSDDIGLVGSKIVYPDGRLQEAGGIIYNDASGENYGKNDHPSRYQYNYVREVDYCSGASIIIKRSVFEGLGGFDDLYQPAYYEDTDLAFSVRKLGLKVIYQPKSVIYHLEGATAGTDLSSGFKKYQAINHKKFKKKWAKELKLQYSPEENYEARDRSHKKMFLIVDEHVPSPDKDSGSVRMAAIIKIVQELGYKVTFFPNYTKHQGSYTESLQQAGVEMVYGDLRFEEFIQRYGQYYDVVMLSRPRIGSYFIDLCQAYCVKAKIIYDTVDLHYLRLGRQADYEAPDLKEYYTDMALKHKELESYLIEEADTALVVSEAEKQILKKEGFSNVSVLSNIHTIKDGAYKVKFDDRRDLVFVGGYQHLPNIDAVKWFVSEVMPLISSKDPSIKLHVVGSAMPDSLREYLNKKPNIIIDGFVEDLTELLSTSRVFVAPMRYGAGVKGKIGQAIEYGIPIVTTTVGAEGMYLEDKKSCLVADMPKNFAKAVLDLYGNQTEWLNLQTSAKTVIADHFSTKKAKEDLKKILAISRVSS